MSFALTSAAFVDGQPIATRHTCEGEDVSPPLAWTEPPPGTRSLALIVTDPDAPAGAFTHWLVWGLEPEAGGLAEGQRGRAEGLNDYGRAGWGGPCPPRGHGLHRYVFHLQALDTRPDLPRGAKQWELERAVAGHVLAIAALVGTYERR